MKRKTLCLIVFLITMIITVSAVSASDDVDNQLSTYDTNVETIKLSDSSLDDKLGDGSDECYIQFESNNITLKDNELNEIQGQLVGTGDEKQFEFKCSYTDNNGINRTYSQITTDPNGIFILDLGSCEGLIARDNPYILTISPDLENDMNFEFYGLNCLNSTLELTIKSAYNLYVSPDGTDAEGYGSKENPYKTIAYAVSQANNNDTIFIYEGNYVESTINLNTARNLTLIGENRNVIITGPTGKRLFDAATTAINVHLTFINLTVNNTDSSTANAIFDLNKNSGINEFINCTVQNSKGIYCIRSIGQTIIDNCEFINHDIYRMLGYIIGINSVNTHSITNTKIDGVVKTVSSNGYIISMTKGDLNIDNMTMTNVDGNLIGINAATNGNSHVTINNSEISNNAFKTTTCGVLFNFAKTTQLTVTNSVIMNNTCDRAIINGLTPAGITLNNNVIINPTYIIYKTGGTSIDLDVVDLDYNYWGTNNPQLNDTLGTNITINNWIVLDITQESPVRHNENVTFTANLKLNNGSELDKEIPKFPVTFKYNNEVITQTMGSEEISATFTYNKNNPTVLINNDEYLIQTKPAYDEIIYVGTNGTDAEGFGNKENPYKTIEYAVSQAKDHTMIYIYEGRYEENPIVISNNLIIVGENKNVVISAVYSNYKLFETSMDSDLQIRVENLTFDNINPGQYNAVLNLRNIGENEIINCTFRNCAGYYAIWSGAETKIIDCEFTNIQNPNKVVYLTGHGDQIIENTSFNNIINSGSGASTVIQIMNSPNNVTLDNITLSSITGKFYGINIGDTSSKDPNTVVIKNSKFIDNQMITTNTIGGVLIYGTNRATIEVVNSVICDNELSNGIIGGSTNATTLIMNNNLIYSNEGNILYSGSKQKPVKLYNFNSNYWGVNNPNLKTNIGSLDIDNWIVLETSHTPTDLENGDNVTVTAQLKLMNKAGDLTDLEEPFFMKMPITLEYAGAKIDTTINDKVEANFTIDDTKSSVKITLINEKQSEKIIEVPEINVTASDIWINLDNTIVINGSAGNITIKLNNKTIIDNETFTGELVYVIKSEDLKLGLNTIVVDYSNSKKTIPGIALKTFEAYKVKPEITIETDDLTIGQPVTITVEIEEATGNITMIVDTNTVNLELNDGVVTYTINNLEAGKHSVIVIYEGNAVYENNIQQTAFNINKLESNVNIEISELKIGEDATISVNVPGATGKVTIIVDGKIAVVQLDATGSAKYVVSNVEAGNHYVTAIYDGDATHNSAYNSSVFKADKKSSEISISAGNVIVGQDTIINVDLTQGTTGFVLIKINDLYYALDITQTNELAIALPVGQYTITATYNGDEEYDSAASSPITVVVKDKTPTEIKIDADDIKVGENAEVTITLPSDATGFVNVIVDGKDIGKLEIGENGTVKVQVASLKAGSHTIDVVYDGDDKYEQSSSSKIITVAKLNAYFEVPYSFTRYAVDYNGGERGAKFYAILKDENGNVLANKTVQIAICGPIYTVTTDEYGRAGLTINLATANRYTYALSFQGDEDYNAAPLGSTTLILNKKTTAINVKDLSFKSTAKTKTVSVKLTTIKNEYDGKTYLNAGKKITLKVNGKTYTAKTDANGVAKFNIQITKKGTYTATVNFAGDQTYKASAKSMKITIK